MAIINKLDLKLGGFKRDWTSAPTLLLLVGAPHVAPPRGVLGVASSALATQVLGRGEVGHVVHVVVLLVVVLPVAVVAVLVEVAALALRRFLQNAVDALGVTVVLRSSRKKRK